MAKHTYEYVKNYISEKSNGECELLSTEYVNSTTPLALKCKCGNVFYSNFNKLRNSLLICKQCRNDLASKRYRTKPEDVIKYINSTGCEYISGEYINNNSMLTLKCRCGNLFEKNLNHYKRGQRQCQKCGAESSRQSKFKYNIESVTDILSKRGYTLLDNEYINCTTPLKCMCSRGHITNIIFNQFLNGSSGCNICAIINRSGENSSLYKGGESEVLENFRKIIKPWKIQIAKKHNYRCALTGAKYDCVVHHLKPFKKIVEESCNELNLPLNRKLKDYENEDYKNLEALVLKKHTDDIGILLQRKVHQKFHSIYGIRNTTVKDFNEFIENNYPHKNRITETED